MVTDRVSGAAAASGGVFAHDSGAAWFQRRWGHLDLLPPLPDGGGEACRRYCSQRAEICGVLPSLQGNLSTHVGVDNLHVLRHVARWCMASCLPAFPHVKSGDVLGLVQRMIHSSSVGASQVSKV